MSAKEEKYRKPRIAVVAHVGEAQGHLLRAIALHESLSESANSLLVVPRKSKGFLDSFFPEIRCEFVDWAFSHNDLFDMGLAEFVRQLKATISDLERIFE